MSKRKSIIGPHASISKGILEAIKYSEFIGGNSTQIFLGSNQSTSLKMKTKITEEEITEIKEYIKEKNHHLIIHTVYLLNFCNEPSSSSKIKYAQDNLIFDINLTEKLGGIGCVLHIGYQKDLDLETAYENMADNVMFCCDKTQKTAPNTKIILETPAGKGSQIGTTLPEFAKLWKMFPKKYHKRLGTCVDTAHIFSSGRDIRTSEGVKEYFKEFDELVGLKFLTCFHINDSKAVLNSRKDLHEGLGQGYIFGSDKDGSLLALKEIYSFATKNRIPMILETHSSGFYDAKKDDGKYYQEVSLFREWDNDKSAEKTFKLKDSFPLPPRKTKKKNNTNDKTVKQSKSKKNKNNKGIKLENNDKIIEIFRKFQKFYEIKSDRIRSNAYQKAIYRIKKMDKDITSIEDVKNIDGIGKKMIDKISEILETGNLKSLEEKNVEKVINDYNEKQKSPLEAIHGIGPQQAKKLQKKGIQNINNLRDRVNNADLSDQQRIGLNYHNNLVQMMSREEGIKLKNKISRALKNSKNSKLEGLKVSLAGSLASGKAETKDLDLIITSSDSNTNTKSKLEKSKLLDEIINYLKEKKIIVETLSSGKLKFIGIGKLNSKSVNRHIDIILTNEEMFPFAFLYFTSGVELNKIMRESAKRNGYKLNEFGLFKDNKLVKVKDEKEIFDLIGVDYIPFKNRK